MRDACVAVRACVSSRIAAWPPMCAATAQVHHFYKDPQPFDDMYAHPFEIFGEALLPACHGGACCCGLSSAPAAGRPCSRTRRHLTACAMHPCVLAGVRVCTTAYYFILFAPPVLLPIHLHAFYIYMAIHGTTGVLDHTGVRVHVPWLYDTAHHDDHHKLTYANYSFPMPFLDVFHGTFSGTFAGKQYSAAAHRREHIRGNAMSLTSPAFVAWAAVAIAALVAYVYMCGWLTAVMAARAAAAS